MSIIEICINLTILDCMNVLCNKHGTLHTWLSGNEWIDTLVRGQTSRKRYLYSKNRSTVRERQGEREMREGVIPLNL